MTTEPTLEIYTNRTDTFDFGIYSLGDLYIDQATNKIHSTVTIDNFTPNFLEWISTFKYIEDVEDTTNFLIRQIQGIDTRNPQSPAETSTNYLLGIGDQSVSAKGPTLIHRTTSWLPSAFYDSDSIDTRNVTGSITPLQTLFPRLFLNSFNLISTDDSTFDITNNPIQIYGIINSTSNNEYLQLLIFNYAESSKISDFNFEYLYIGRLQQPNTALLGTNEIDQLVCIRSIKMDSPLQPYGRADMSTPYDSGDFIITGFNKQQLNINTTVDYNISDLPSSLKIHNSTGDLLGSLSGLTLSKASSLPPNLMNIGNPGQFAPPRYLTIGKLNGLHVAMQTVPSNTHHRNPIVDTATDQEKRNPLTKRFELLCPYWWSTL